MAAVKDLIQKKNQTILTISPQATVFEAIRVMNDRNVGALMVTTGKQIHGIVTERDYLRKVALKNRASKSTPVADIMSAKLVYVTPSETVGDCMAIMTERHVRHLPVMDEGVLTGLISVGDLIKELSAEQQAQIRFLEEYIAGSYPG